MKQKWDCSEVEDDIGEGDVMDWFENDKMTRHWEDVCEEEEKIAVRKWKVRAFKLKESTRYLLKK